jgi:glutamate-ammonia-ligase adenylyltransferase
LCGSEAARANAARLLKETLQALPWSPQVAGEIVRLRQQLAQTASPENLKRGSGGTIDIEWVAQSLQLRHAAASSEILAPNTFVALQKLADAGYLDRPLAETLAENYRMLRSLESNLRLLDTSARHELPTDRDSLQRLAFLMDDHDSPSLAERCAAVRHQNRERFDQIIAGL